MSRTVRTLASAVVLAASATALHAQTTPPASNMPSGATDTALVAQLDSVNTAARAGLTNLSPSVAASLVGGIRGKLAASRNPALQSIATDLAALQRELGMSTVDGARVGAILRRVGPKVTRVAATQSGAVASTLREIGSELTSSGRQLSGATAGAGTR